MVKFTPKLVYQWEWVGLGTGLDLVEKGNHLKPKAGLVVIQPAATQVSQPSINISELQLGHMHLPDMPSYVHHSSQLTPETPAK
jgi:hypothetical protein